MRPKTIRVWEVIDATGRIVKVFRSAKAAYDYGRKITLAGWRVRETSYSNN